MNAQPDVLHVLDGGVLTVTLNRPKKLNAFTFEMERAYLEVLAEAGEDDDVGAIVVTGAGPAFCAGADLELLDALDPTMLRHHQATSAVPLDVAMSLPKPVIAAINGAAAGVGLLHALMADRRFAAASAIFTTAYARHGLVAENGIAWLLPRLVGTSRAIDLLWTARRFDATDALAFGIVDEVVEDEPVLDRAIRYARSLLEGTSPYSIASMKRQVLDAWDQTRAEAMRVADALVDQSIGRRYAGRLDGQRQDV